MFWNDSVSKKECVSDQLLDPQMAPKYSSLLKNTLKIQFSDKHLPNQRIIQSFEEETLLCLAHYKQTQ